MRRAIVLVLTTAALLSIAPAANATPANDDFANAIEIASLPFADRVYTYEATREETEPDACGLRPRGSSVWYRYTAALAGPLVASTRYSWYDTVVTVYTGSSLTDLTATACDVRDQYDSRVGFAAVQGETYWIQVAGENRWDDGLLRFRFYAAGEISGIVTSDGVAALQGICVYAHKSRWRSVAAAVTDASGSYTLRVRPGEYAVRFADCRDQGWVSEWYADVLSFERATFLAVNEYSSLSGIDAVLSPEGTISGIVTDGSGAALDYVCVTAYDAAGEFADSAYTDYLGLYRIGDLPAGEFRVRFEDCSYLDDYLPEWFVDAPNFREATPVPVTAGADTGAIDAVLAARSRPDVAVAEIVVEKVPLETEVGPLPVTGTDRRIRIRLDNIGGDDAYWTHLTVRACPRSVGSCVPIHAGWIREIEAGASVERAIRWNAAAIVGDWTIDAFVWSYDDVDRSNDAMEVEGFTGIGGSGAGVRVPSPTIPYVPRCYYLPVVGYRCIPI